MLRTVAATGAPGKTIRVRLSLPKRTARRLRARSVAFTVAVTAADANGNVARKVLRVKTRR